MDKILILLDLQKQANQADDFPALEFIILNHSNQLISYTQAIFWKKTELGIKLGNISGNMTLDHNATYAQYLKSFIKKELPKTEDNCRAFSENSLPVEEKENWKNMFAPHAALLTFTSKKDDICAGIWLERNTPFDEKDKALLSELASAYTPPYALLALRKKSKIASPLKHIKKHNKVISFGFMALCFLPVRLSITAPAEIIAQNPTIATIPYDGVLKKIHVKPGDPVTENQTLFTMDQTEIKSQIETTNQALKAAQNNLARMRRESLRTPEKKSELTRLENEITERRIENEYAQKLSQKSTVKALKAGIAILSDTSLFEGQPLRTGEKILTIANPEENELLIKVPVDTMLPITKKSPVNFHLNVSPLKGHTAKIRSIGYQASPDPDGLLTYKIRARINQETNTKPARIGWKGTAKIKGSWTILGYSILRRPLIALRKITGI